MNKIELLFLEALRASLRNADVEWTDDVSAEDWKLLFRMAQEHSVLPMIYEAVYRSPAFASCDPAVSKMMKRTSIKQVMRQTMAGAEFVELFSKLKQAGIRPCVVKGIVCRNLYPNPDYRPSSDEDVFIPAEQYELCHQVLLAEGMSLADPKQNTLEDYEVPYMRQGSMLYIEIHKHLFAPDEIAYGHFNDYFDGIHDKLITIDVAGGTVDTMPASDHLFYLVCHAFKHFIHGGFGLRQVCDILLFAQRYHAEIDWDDLFVKCEEIAACHFLASIIVIGDKYLGISQNDYELTDQWKALLNIDESMMLKDLLDAGIYGNTEAARKRSSNITVAALAAKKQGKKQKSSLSSTLFPPIATLKGRYTYLERYSFLLPIAWMSRILKYVADKRRNQDAASADILRIGNERVELMRKYGIID